MPSSACARAPSGTCFHPHAHAGELPYLLALDQPTKSVVLSIRGTVSVADLATDMLADPEPMEEWLPDTMTQVGPVSYTCAAAAAAGTAAITLHQFSCNYSMSLL